VAVKSQGRFLTPPAMPIWSRTGPIHNSRQAARRNKRNDHSAARTFLRRRRHRALQPAGQRRHGASDSFCLSSAALTFWPYPGAPRWKSPRIKPACRPPPDQSRHRAPVPAANLHGFLIIAGNRYREPGGSTVRFAFQRSCRRERVEGAHQWAPGRYFAK